MAENYGYSTRFAAFFDGISLMKSVRSEQKNPAGMQSFAPRRDRFSRLYFLCVRITGSL